MAADDLVKLMYVSLAARLLTETRNPDGSLDPKKVQEVAKSLYRKEVAQRIHPDKVNGDPQYTGLFSTATTANDAVQSDSDAIVVAAAQAIIALKFGGSDDQEMLAAAAAVIEGLTTEKDDLVARVARLNAELTSVYRGRRLGPEQIEVFRDPRTGYRVTLANAEREISRLLAGQRATNPGVERRLQEAERLLQDVRENLQRTQAYANDQNRDAQEWRQRAQEARRQASEEAARTRQQKGLYDAEKVARVALDTQYQAVLLAVRDEKEVRAAMEARAVSLQDVLEATTIAADALLKKVVSEQKDAYDQKMRVLEEAIKTDDPTEDLLQERAVTRGSVAEYALAQYLIARESVKEFKDEEKIKRAKENIKKSLEKDYSLLENMLSLARYHQMSGQNDLAVGIMEGVYAAVDNTRDMGVRIKAGSEGHFSYAPLFSVLVTRLNEQKEDSVQRKETRIKLTGVVTENLEFEEPLFQAGVALRLQREFSLAEEIGIALAHATNKPKYWKFIGDTISASSTARRPERVAWASECYKKAGNLIT